MTKMSPQHLVVFNHQDWVITPAALALSDQGPRDTREQKWLLVLTGCLPCSVSWPPPGSTDREAPAGSQYIAFLPDIKNPCLYAINHYGVPRPAGAEGAEYRVEFKIEQCAPFVGVTMSEITPAADWQSTTGIIRWYTMYGWGREASSGDQISGFGASTTPRRARSAREQWEHAQYIRPVPLLYLLQPGYGCRIPGLNQPTDISGRLL
jgi:hypothetical protein